MVTAKRIPKYNRSYSGQKWSDKKCRNNLPVPEPIAPRASAITERAPIHIPPNQAAVGMYLKILLYFLS